ncbi:unnamed protein product [Coregonus sp. 'balchen']|nr:unnamed protein product [Coregonus sp. 'balchen']
MKETEPAERLLETIWFPLYYELVYGVRVPPYYELVYGFPLYYELVYGSGFPLYYEVVYGSGFPLYYELVYGSGFPLYYEIKIAFVIWLLSPYTRGAGLIYRKCLHPLLSSRERGQGAITEKLRSFSMHDLTQIPLDDAAANQIYTAHAGNPAVSRRALTADATDRTEYYAYEQEDRTDEEGEQLFSEDEAVTQRGLRRSQSVKIMRSKARKDVSLNITHSKACKDNGAEELFSVILWRTVLRNCSPSFSGERC